MSIYSSVTGKSFDEIEKEFDGKGYGVFKEAVGESVADMLAPIRENFKKFSQDKEYLEKCYTEGAAAANRIAYKTLDKVYRKCGFVKKPF